MPKKNDTKSLEFRGYVSSPEALKHAPKKSYLILIIALLKLFPLPNGL